MQRSALIILFISICLPALAAEIDDDSVFRHQQLGVYIMLPERWTVTNQTGYPSILCYMFPEANDASVNLAVGRLLPGEDVTKVARRNLASLRKLDIITVEEKPLSLPKSSGWQAVLKVKNSERKQLQVYLVSGARYFTLTYSALPAQYSLYLPDVFQILESLIANLSEGQA